MDECKNCTVRGHLEECLKTECNLHDSWYARMLKDYLVGCSKGFFKIADLAEKQSDDSISIISNYHIIKIHCLLKILDKNE